MQRTSERGLSHLDMEPLGLEDEPASALESLVESVEMLASHVLEGVDARHPRAEELVSAFREGLLRGEPPVARLAPRPLLPPAATPVESKAKEAEGEDDESKDPDDAEGDAASAEDADGDAVQANQGDSKDDVAKKDAATSGSSEQTKPPTKFLARMAARRRKKSDPRDGLIAAARSEPFLALELLRQSSRPGWGGRSLDLRLAARTIPLARLRKLVAGAGTVDSVGAWDLLLENVRRHAMLTARTAELVARGRMRRDSGALYTMALVHNVGELAIIDLYRNLGQEPPADGIARGALANEMKRFHAPVGALILRRWELPLVVVAVAEHHHDPLPIRRAGPSLATPRWWPPRRPRSPVRVSNTERSTTMSTLPFVSVRRCWESPPRFSKMPRRRLWRSGHVRVQTRLRFGEDIATVSAPGRPRKSMIDVRRGTWSLW